MKLLTVLILLSFLLKFSAQTKNLKIKYFNKQSAYGVINIETKEIIIEPKYNKISFFYQNDTITNLLGVTDYDKEDNSHHSYLINLNGERVSNFSAHNIDYQMGSFSYFNKKYYGRPYNIDTNCVCIPKNYTPCPNRVPIDTSKSTITQKNIQKLEWLFEFESIDSTLSVLNNFILKYKNEPQYYFYKAWLLQHGFGTYYTRVDLEGYYNYYNYNHDGSDMFKRSPKYIWDFNHELDSTYINQMTALKRAIESLDFDWEERNKFYENNSYDSLNLIMVYSLLEKVMELENNDKNISYIVHAWQHNLLLYNLGKRDKKKIKKLELEIKQMKKRDYIVFPSKHGLIASSYYRYSKHPAYGIKVGMGLSEKQSIWLYDYFIKIQFGYEKFILDPKLQAFTLSEEILFANGSIESGTISEPGRGLNIKNLSLDILSLSFLSKKDGYTAVSYAPELGVHFWNFTINGGYYFVNKKKFPLLKGPFAQVNFTMYLYNKKDYSYIYSGGTNLFQ